MSKKKNLGDISQQVESISEGQVGQLMAGFAALPPETQSALVGGAGWNVFCARNKNCSGANCTSGCGGTESPTEGGDDTIA